MRDARPKRDCSGRSNLGNGEKGEIGDFFAAITKSSFRRHFHVTSPRQDWLSPRFPKARCFDSMAESINGWRDDPFGEHEFRYFSNDERPTRLVSDGGVRSYDSALGARRMTAQSMPFGTHSPVQAGPPTLSVEPDPAPPSAAPPGPSRRGAQMRRRVIPARVALSARRFYRSGWRKPVIGVAICGLLALGGEIATAATSDGPPSTTLQQGVYVGAADPSGVASFAAATQTDPTIASDYLPSTSRLGRHGRIRGLLAWIFPSLANVGSDNAMGWTGSGYTISLGVPMIPTWPDGGRGSDDPPEPWPTAPTVTTTTTSWRWPRTWSTPARQRISAARVGVRRRLVRLERHQSRRRGELCGVLPADRDSDALGSRGELQVRLEPRRRGVRTGRGVLRPELQRGPGLPRQRVRRLHRRGRVRPDLGHAPDSIERVGRNDVPRADGGGAVRAGAGEARSPFPNGAWPCAPTVTVSATILSTSTT